MWYMDKEYMKKHLARYIEFQMQQGYGSDDVKQALLKYGYDDQLLEEIFSTIDPETHKPARERPSIKELNDDLYLYIQNLLVDYIKSELNNGYELDVIEKALVNYGHHPRMVKDAVRTVHDGRFIDQAPSIKFSVNITLTSAIIFALVFVVGLTAVTEASLGTVILSFSPSLLSIFLSYALFMSVPQKKHEQMVPLVAVIFTVVGFIMLIRMNPALRLGEPQTVIILNAVLAFVTSALISLFSKKPHKVVIDGDTVQQGAQVSQSS